MKTQDPLNFGPNPKSLQPHTLYIPGKSKTDKRKSGGMDGNGRYDQQKQRVAGRKLFSLGLMMCDGNAPRPWRARQMQIRARFENSVGTNFKSRRALQIACAPIS